MSDYILCIVASFKREEQISAVISESLFPTRFLANESNLAENMKEAKESGKPIVLLILGPAGEKAIEYFCDDHDKPESERRVKWMHSVSAGVDWYHLETHRKEMGSIPITTGRGVYSFYLGMHVATSILYFNSQVSVFQASKEAKKWDVFPLRDIVGLKVGILGYGDIGRETAKILTPLKLSLTGVRRGTPEAAVDDLGVTQLSGPEATEQVIRESDFLINALPATKETNGLFNRSTFEKMKKSAVYINIGRGSTQVDDDLAAVLQEGVIAGAAVDVFQVEPLPPSSPLWEVPNSKILLTPHNVCVTTESFNMAVQRFITNAEEFLKCGKVSGYTASIDTGY
ncbi:D-isomer specific 2-hydroxyacid dehydrogenase-protein [Angomonas deanei]|nr:D-isomer specific 2-hydroxyacid dehydrogenase-protein [Angomonas deanei]|eukprot:EPY39283.1 D-isomer specific 2-hydroxyacid dehydrogenase-protein [Angomonas deanei]